jgi:hypothetical protein
MARFLLVLIAKTPPLNANQPLKTLSPVEGATTYTHPGIAGTGPANTTITLYEAHVGGREWGRRNRFAPTPLKTANFPQNAWEPSCRPIAILRQLLHSEQIETIVRAGKP